MTKEMLNEALNYVNHSREKRLEMAKLMLGNPHLIAPLMEIAFDIKNPISFRACWVMEFTAKQKLEYLFPHLDVFVAHINHLQKDSAIRPMAKICEYLILSYFSKTKNSTQEVVTEMHLEKITACCFDWLIGEYKVAAKAYAMTSLYLLGTKYDWVHPELQLVLEQNYPQGSAAYKARARHTFEKMKKFKAS